MKHNDTFETFLSEVVDLNATRLLQLESRTNALKKVVAEGSWGPQILSWLPHGSWAHETIIKPVDQGEFDADLIVFVQPVDGWTAKKYIDQLYSLLDENGTYTGKVIRSSHCVTVSYANDCKVDIAPCVASQSVIFVCNRNSNEFEVTRPVEFTNWLIAVNEGLGANVFRKVTRLLKYLRHIKKRFTCSSILFTTLLAKEVRQGDQGSMEFADVPTALKTLVSRLDDWLQQNEAKPSVTNPCLVSEDFALAWSDHQYSTFRDRFHVYREWIDEAFDEEDESESLSKWQRVFGEDFGKKEADDAGREVEKAFLRVKRAMGWPLLSDDPVELVKSYGLPAIPRGFEKKPYMQQPLRKWGRRPQFIDRTLRVDLYASRESSSLGPVVSGQPLPPRNFLRFRVFLRTGSPLNGHGWGVDWRVTNTGPVAASAQCLRGRIEQPEPDLSRWEWLEYRGVHLVEAFIIDLRNDCIVDQTDPFYVVIE